MTTTLASNSMGHLDWKTLKLTYNSNVETDTGYDVPKNAIIPWWSMAVFVQTIDATETLEVGILASETGGDADGFLNVLDIATAGWVFPYMTATDATGTNYVSANTYGALFSAGVDGGNAAGTPGLTIMKNFLGNGLAESISYTCTSGSDTFVGFLRFAIIQYPDLTDYLT
jgi:hypothetical protein